jgi:hypothetical protein
MSAISQTKLYEQLLPKLGKEATESLITFSESKTKSEVENTCKHLASREDLANTKSDLIKWMFVFWIGQVIATFAFILLFLRK